MPLGDGPEAHCSYCGASVPIPPEDLALRADHEARHEDVARIDALYAEASRPPARILDLWATLGSLAGMVMLIGGLIITFVTVITVFVIEVHGTAGFFDAVATAGFAGFVMLFLAIPTYIETFVHLVGSHGLDVADALGP